MSQESAIEVLRRANFDDLVKTTFTLTLREGEAGSKQLALLENPENSHTFAALIDAGLKSELARDLVRRGYIDRNFSLYAAQFYGNFTGVDVANYMVQHVQPNIMNIDYDLSRKKDGEREGAAANLLLEAEEAGEDLLNTVAAFNIDLVNHLLKVSHTGANTVVRLIIATWPTEDTRNFLAAYFTSKNAQREELAALLTRCRWRNVFDYFISHEDVPTDARVTLVNAALAAFDSSAAYELGENVCDFLTANYRSMSVFTGESETANTRRGSNSEAEQRLAVLLQRINLVLPELEPLSGELRTIVVDANQYALTADNLRVALSLEESDPVQLETLTDGAAGNETVYAYALANLSGYLAAIDNDNETTAAVVTPQTLAKVLNDLGTLWTDQQSSEEQNGPSNNDLVDLLAHTSPSAQLRYLRDAPLDMWKALAAAKLFRSSLANIEAYRNQFDSIDEHLAQLLEDASTVYVDEDGDVTDPDGEEYDRATAALAILNTDSLSTQVRVGLVSSLQPVIPLPALEIVAEGSDLFALLIDAGFVSDDAETFTHLRAGGWAAMGPAIVASAGVGSFLSATLLDGMVENALDDGATSVKVAQKILENVTEYVPEDDWASLRAVAVYADRHRVRLDASIVGRIARVGDGRVGNDTSMILRLLCRASPTPSADDVVGTFLHLGEPYNRITNSQDSFELDFNEVNDRLLKILYAANRINRGYPRRPNRRYSVTVI